MTDYISQNDKKRQAVAQAFPLQFNIAEHKLKIEANTSFEA